MKPITCAYVVLLAGVCSALHIAKIGPALPVLRLEFGLTDMQAGLLLSIVQLAGMLLGLLIGSMVEGWGLKRSMVAGLGLLALTSLSGTFADSATTLLLLRGLEGAGFLLVVMPAPAMLRQLTTPGELSRMLGLWGAYMPFGTAISLLAGAIVINWLNWRPWWFLLGLLTLLMAGGAYRFLPAPAAKTSTPNTTPHIRTLFNGLQTRLALTLKSPGPWLIAIAFGMYSGQWLAVVGFLPSIYAQAGIPAGLVGVMTATVAAANIIGNVWAGHLLARGRSAPKLLAIGFITMGICSVFAFATLNLHFSGLAWLRFVAVIVFSALGGLIPGTLFSLAIELAPDRNTISTTVGWMQQISSSGQFLLPPMVGALADANHGSWQWTWVIMCACCLAGLWVAWRCARLVRSIR